MKNTAMVFLIWCHKNADPRIVQTYMLSSGCVEVWLSPKIGSNLIEYRHLKKFCSPLSSKINALSFLQKFLKSCVPISLSAASLIFSKFIFLRLKKYLYSRNFQLNRASKWSGTGQYPWILISFGRLLFNKKTYGSTSLSLGIFTSFTSSFNSFGSFSSTAVRLDRFLTKHENT